MPEYLAPGVYVEETSFRNKSIEGVSTTTTGFIGPTRYGPIDLEPDIITSLGEFERTYGDRQKMDFGGDEFDNFMWHAARAFFEEGGKRLYVARIFRPLKDVDEDHSLAVRIAECCGKASVPTNGDAGDAIHVRARFPGIAGNMKVSFTLRLGQNILAEETEKRGGLSVTVNKVKSLFPGDVVWMDDIASPIQSPPSGDLYMAQFDESTQTWSFKPAVGNPIELKDVQSGGIIRVLSLAVTVEPSDVNGSAQVWADLPLDPGHMRGSVHDSFTDKFDPTPVNRAQERTLPIIITPGDNVDNGLKVLAALFAAKADWKMQLEDPKSTDRERTYTFVLGNGNDGRRPGPTEYEGVDDENASVKTGLKTFEDIEDISIVAAPGSTSGYETNFSSEARAIVNLMIAHAQRMRYRIAVLDSGDKQSIAQVRAMRARIDSTHAALYFPWVRVLDPVTRAEINLPPSGFVAGIYARNDIQRAVYKAPANEVVNLAIGFEQTLNKAQQEVLNPEGINCFRFFEGRGFRLWGARTISSDPEWKYVNLRRYFAYLERSIDKGTQWAVFEPNGERLWANVRSTIADFLLNEWQMGALLGDKPELAYFVKCDRSTMTQNDLDNGRLVCLIGVAPLRPAEFVIFRIGQWTADKRS
jgi:hypothetical protein